MVNCYISCISGQLIQLYIHIIIIYYSEIKKNEILIDVTNMDKPQTYCANFKKTYLKTTCFRIYLFVMSRKGKSMETESRLVIV